MQIRIHILNLLTYQLTVNLFRQFDRNDADPVIIGSPLESRRSGRTNTQNPRLDIMRLARLADNQMTAGRRTKRQPRNILERHHIGIPHFLRQELRILGENRTNLFLALEQNLKIILMNQRHTQNAELRHTAQKLLRLLIHAALINLINHIGEQIMKRLKTSLYKNRRP